jgi:UDP-N-acetylglucosamine 2-epimerase (non-hydrolysing)
MNKLKLMTIVGTRPEIIRLSEIIKKLEINSNHILVHTGQNYDYELNQVFFDELGLSPPDYVLETAGGSSSEIIGKVIIESSFIIEKEKPDAILILGDTNSSLAAIPAKRNKVPIFHMEAGNRCFDQIVPEEINRKIVDHISDINLCYSQISKSHLISEGIKHDRVIVTGSPLNEVIQANIEKIESSKILQELSIQKGKYFVVSSHREENVDNDEKLINLIISLNNLAQEFKLPIIFSTHPRTKNKLKNLDLEIHSLIIFNKPFGFIDYINLQKNSKCVISDSGTITEEASILNLPAINIRDCHERPEGFEEGVLIMTGFNSDRIIQSINILCQESDSKERKIKIVSDYEPDNVSEKILRIIYSYTDFINRVVWKK